MRVGINGYGRMGRLALRAGWERDDLEFVAINDPGAGAATFALLTEFDSVQGRWTRPCSALGEDRLVLDGRELPLSRHTEPGEIPWKELGVDLVLECSGRFRTRASLEPHFSAGASRVVVSAPMADGTPNLVLGVNHQACDLGQHRIVSAASCTTNCLAPVVRVLHDAIGIERGLITTIHAPTATQRVVDGQHKDPRRARAAQLSLIPTSTNSAVTVGRIIPELEGKLDAIAVRAPVLNASLVDCVFQVARRTSAEEVNDLLRAASGCAPLEGILGFEERPLVSVDFAGDPRSAVVDGLSTRVTDGVLLKVLAWYDNEWGYANRLVELAGLVAAAMPAAHA